MHSILYWVIEYDETQYSRKLEKDILTITRSEPISEVWGSQPVSRHYFQNISLVEKLWKLFSRQRGSSSVLLRQRKVILCCCETTFLIIAELAYSLTYQIIISPIPSIPDFVYIHFAQKIIWTVNACLHSNSPCFTLDLQSLWQSTHAWAYVEKRAKYFKRRTHYVW